MKQINVFSAIFIYLFYFSTKHVLLHKLCTFKEGRHAKSQKLIAVKLTSPFPGADPIYIDTFVFIVIFLFFCKNKKRCGLKKIWFHTSTCY